MNGSSPRLRNPSAEVFPGFSAAEGFGRTEGAAGVPPEDVDGEGGRSPFRRVREQLPTTCVDTRERPDANRLPDPPASVPG